MPGVNQSGGGDVAEFTLRRGGGNTGAQGAGDGLQPRLIHDSWVDRKGQENMTFYDLRRDAWMGGQLLAFSALDGTTDFENALVARTAFGTPGIDVKFPAHCRIRFPLSAGKDNVVAGDWFCLGEAVQGAFLDTHHLLIEGPCEVLDAAPAIASFTNANRTLIGSASHIDAAKLNSDMESVLRDRGRWLRSLRIPSCTSIATRRTLLKSLSVMKTQVYSPEGMIRHRWTTPDRWPHRRMWLWDSVFHAIGWRHVDPELARDAITAVLDMQATNGFVAHMMDPNGTSEITQPPILALGAKLVHDISPVDGWIESMYPKLCAYVEWDMANRDRDGAGLLEWEITGDPHCRSGESGMDNSPRFDAATQMDAVDFNSFLALECEILAEFAASLDLNGDAAKWKSTHARLCSLIAGRLWSEKLGFFVDYDIDRHAQSPVLASSGFLPLICGAATLTQAARLAEHLRDPRMFGTAFPVPSIAANDIQHYAKDMWRGPVWINLNWLIASGFDRYGFDDLATALRAQTMREIEKFCEKYGVLFEFYDDRREVDPPQLLRKGKGAPEESQYHQALHDYGWTASLYVDLVCSTKEARQQTSESPNRVAGNECGPGRI